MKTHRFYLLSLGCAKNTVDSQSMAEILTQSGYQPVEKPSQAGVLIVNTCGFIEAARQESLQALQDLAKRKRKDQVLVAAGCLTDRYRQKLVEEVPGLDGILSTRRWMDILDMLDKLSTRRSREPLYHIPDVPTVGLDEHGVIRAAAQGSSAYLKIADGCRRPCAFCSIPLIKGTAVSRPEQTIVQEAVVLQDAGIQELILIAQDTTDYGSDLGMKDGLANLLEQITTTAPEIPWIRLMYAYPGFVTDRLIEVMASHKQILPYLDIPLQHAHPETLRRMRRPANMDWVHQTIAKMRAAMPDLSLRTTFIVGYPGETETEFQALLDFVQTIRFDHVGVFNFSFEPGTTSEPLGDPIPPEVKESRREAVMRLQESISLAKNQTFVGKTLDVLVEGCENGISVGRSYRDAPEIDGLVLIEDETEPGQIIPVQITGAMVHDLTGRLYPPQ
ncbi:MAG TPA: 30S ribosomal protein S12 methylthiotransferase RimO [Anaerolineaceae bacterium]|nr:30S ribosomal protein S12 methylthiotransferase RimO [Anaerolineaceae bacterium]